MVFVGAPQDADALITTNDAAEHASRLIVDFPRLTITSGLIVWTIGMEQSLFDRKPENLPRSSKGTGTTRASFSPVQFLLGSYSPIIGHCRCDIQRKNGVISFALDLSMGNVRLIHKNRCARH